MALVFFFMLILVNSAFSQSTEKNEILRLCGKSFQRIADKERILFEVNRFHVLRAEFDKRNRLIEMAIEPKYYFEDDHPDWKESDDFADLSEVEFSTLRTQLERIKPTGELVQPANSILVVTNMTGWKTEYYSKASLTWGVVVDLRKGDNPPYEVRWFRFKYGANVKIQRKTKQGPKDLFPPIIASPNPITQNEVNRE